MSYFTRPSAVLVSSVGKPRIVLGEGTVSSLCMPTFHDQRLSLNVLMGNLVHGTVHEFLDTALQNHSQYDFMSQQAWHDSYLCGKRLNHAPSLPPEGVKLRKAPRAVGQQLFAAGIISGVISRLFYASRQMSFLFHSSLPFSGIFLPQRKNEEGQDNSMVNISFPRFAGKKKRGKLVFFQSPSFRKRRGMRVSQHSARQNTMKSRKRMNILYF